MRNDLTTGEESTWYSQYIHLLDAFKPDLVYFYGGQTLDMLISDEAHAQMWDSVHVPLRLAAYSGTINQFDGTS